MSKAGSGHIVDAVAEVYAQALLDMADEAGRLGGVGETLEGLGGLLELQPDLWLLLTSPIISVQERASSIEAIFKGRIDDVAYRFLQVLNEKDRLGALPGMIVAYARLLDERNGVVEADLFVAEALPDGQSQAVSDRIGQFVGCKVVLREHVDPALIGGVKVRVGDQLIDGSVATQLKLIRGGLITAGAQRTREELAAQ